MALSVQNGYLARRVSIPLSDGDSRILLDATLTSSAAATGAGFTLVGTGHVFDSNGFNGKGTGNLNIANWASAASVVPQGTIYLQVERAALSFSNANNGADFSDSTGTDNGASRYLLYSNNDGFTHERRVYVDGAGTDGLVFLNEANNTQATSVLNRYNSHAVLTYQDQQYAEIVWTWRDTTYWIYIDGHVVFRGTSALSPTTSDLDNIRLGSQNASTGWLGDFYIKRIQISSAFAPPVMLPLRVAGYGDSFVVASIESATPGADTVAGINAVQTHTALTARDANYKKVRGQASWMHALQALAWQNNGAFFPYYMGGKAGAGYEKSAIASGYRDAINAYQPELIIAMSSVNDVNPSSPVTNIVANTKTMFDALIDGNAKLRKILFFVGFSGHQDASTGGVEGWLTEYKRISALLTAGLADYRDKVEVVDVYEAWGGDSYPVSQTAGSNVDNVTATAGEDVHPSASGHLKMAEIMWPHVQNFLLLRPTR